MREKTVNKFRLLQNMRDNLEDSVDKKGCVYYFKYNDQNISKDFDVLLDFLNEKGLFKPAKDIFSAFRSPHLISRYHDQAKLMWKNTNKSQLRDKIDELLLEMFDYDSSGFSKNGVDEAATPVVAVSFYSRRTKTEKGYYDGIFNPGERDNVTNLIRGLQTAALKYGHQPPQLEITLFLVPDWESNETFSSPSYLEANARMLEEAKAYYDHDIDIKDFLKSGAEEEEYAFLDQCLSMGSVADLVKSRLIIDNQGRKCLQTDANVLWANHDFDTLYKLTFMQNYDAFNASRCSDVYIAAHNKLIYIDATSRFPSLLKQELLDYCKTYKDNGLHKSKTFNGVYDFAFTRAMYLHNATYIVSIDDKYNPGKKFEFYPAKLTDPRYTLISMVIPCQQESWRAQSGEESNALKELKGQFLLDSGLKKPAFMVEVCGVICGFHHFKSIVKAYINCPIWHSNEINYTNYAETRDKFEYAKYAHQLFVDRLNDDVCQEIMIKYYNAVLEAYHRGDFICDPFFELTGLFETGNQASENLCQYFFSCSVKELKENPKRTASRHDAEISLFVPIVPSFASLNPEKFKLSELVVSYSSKELMERVNSDRKLECSSSPLPISDTPNPFPARFKS
jgi:hypothetical protein